MKMSIQKLLTFCCVLFAIVIFADVAKACMCHESSVGSEFSKSNNIIIAKLKPYELYKINSEKKQSNSDLKVDLSSVRARMLPKLEVQKVLKGNLQMGEVLDFDGVFGCNVVFAEVGENYLLYLGDEPQQDKLWQVPGCSKSGLLKNRLADILYISKEEKVRNKTRLAGRLFIYENPTFTNKISQLPTLANRKVYLFGDKQVYEASTDKNGVYEIYDLPAGTYRIIAENIQGWTSIVSNYDSDTVEIAKSGQYERNFRYTVDSLNSKKIKE